MKESPMRQNLGHLILAIWLSTVPTAITYGALGLHGLNICNNLGRQIQTKDLAVIKKKCSSTAWYTTRSYIFLIGFFITLPTWFWFYLSVKTRKKRSARKDPQNQLT